MMVSVAVRDPAAVGVNVTLTAQFTPARNELPQVFVCAKSPELVPVRERLEMARVTIPVFVRVRVWTGLAVPMG